MEYLSRSTKNNKLERQTNEYDKENGVVIIWQNWAEILKLVWSSIKSTNNFLILENILIESPGLKKRARYSHSAMKLFGRRLLPVKNENVAWRRQQLIVIFAVVYRTFYKITEIFIRLKK